jgi:hypothetical protein
MAAGCRGPPAPGRGGLQAIDVAEARRQARLHDVGQQVLKNDVDGYKHRYRWRVGKLRHADDQRSTVGAHADGVTFSKGYVAWDRTDECIGARGLSASTDPPQTQNQQQQDKHPKANGAAAGAAIGAAPTRNAAKGYRKSGFPGRPVGCHFSGTSPTDNYRGGRTPRRRCRTLVN